MAKPVLFIGSSVEQLELARAVQSNLERDATPSEWTQGTFPPSHFPLEALDKVFDLADFAVFICAPDDVVETKRDERMSVVRDNVIFEIGLAIGKLGRKRTFLIKPRDTNMHLPSDLSGLFPETYDPGDLKNPRAALGPACSNIRDAIKEIGPRAKAAPALQELESAESKEEKSPVAIPPTPNSEWQPSKYEWEFLLASYRDDSERMLEIDQAFQASVYAKTEEQVAEWEARKEVAKIDAGKKGNVQLIRDLSEQYPANGKLKQFLGRALEYYNDERGSTSAHLEAARVSKNMQELSTAVYWATMGTLEHVALLELRNLVVGMKFSGSREKGLMINALTALSKAAKLEDVASAISEVALSLSPDDVTRRFDLARQYSDDGLNELSMFHYSRIPTDERSAAVWNNLGVSYARLQIPGMATDAYKLAEKAGNSIATGNLAQNLVSAGFFDEAKDRLENALGDDEHREGFIKALATISETRDSEKEEVQANETTAKERQEIRYEIGMSALTSSGPDIEGHWETGHGQVLLRQESDSKYVGYGEATKRVTAAPFGLLFAPVRTETTKITIALTRFGNALQGSITLDNSDSALTLLGSFAREKKVLLQVRSDGIITGIEVGSDKEITWQRADTNAKLIDHSVDEL